MSVTKEQDPFQSGGQRSGFGYARDLRILRQYGVLDGNPNKICCGPPIEFYDEETIRLLFTTGIKAIVASNIK